jgi:hypothetical protein
LLLGLIRECLGWDAACPGLEATRRRELARESELDEWGVIRTGSPDGWEGKGNESGWDMPVEGGVEVSIRVQSHVEVSAESSTCRFRFYLIDLLLV